MGPEKTLDLCAAEKFGGVFRLKTTISQIHKSCCFDFDDGIQDYNGGGDFCAAGKF